MKNKIIIVVLTLVALILFGIFGYRQYQDYLYQKSLEELADYARSSVSLTREQLDVIADNAEKALHDLDTSLFVRSDTSFDGIDIDVDESLLNSGDNVDEFIKNHKRLFEYYLKFVTVKPNYDESAIFTYKNGVIDKVIATFDFTYPDLERIIEYDLFKEYATNKKSDMELGLLTDTIKNYVNKRGLELSVTSTMQLDILVADAENNTFIFLDPWLNNLDFCEYLTSYNYKSGSFDTCELDTNYEIIDRFNSGDFEWIAQSLAENASKYNYSNYDNSEYIYFNRMEAKYKQQLADEYLSIGTFDVTPININITLDGDEDSNTSISGDYLLASVPYVNYDQEGVGFRHETKTSFIESSYAEVYTCLYDVLAGVDEIEDNETE